MANVSELDRSRVRPLPVGWAGRARVELCMTGIVRAGARAITPVTGGSRVRVGDRLIGRYRSRALEPREELQLGVRARAPGPRALGDEPARELDEDPRGQPDTPEGDVWELDTRHMSPGDYTLTLRVISRELDERGSRVRCHGAVTLGFCLDPRTPTSRPDGSRNSREP